jgi:phospholipase/carboxylesterase
MPLQTIELDPGRDPVATVVMLHGLGADGTDFLPMADEIDLGAIGPVRWVLPRAPVRPVTINGGYRMRAWYDVFEPSLVRREDDAGLRESFALVAKLLEREAKRGVAPERTVLAGFSQGCAITLGAGLRHGERLAGLAGLSGYLPLADSTAAERAEANRATPIFLAHGRHDGVVAVERGQAARDVLQGLGYGVTWHEYPMEHSVCIDEVQAFGDWLVQVLAA